ncbi:MAG TPA: DnaJ C-terminal domain-containing protein [Casimicrobiaceae bacterium]
MKYKDYYAILGVARSAGADEIKAAYRKLARKYHPDVSKEKDAEEKFKEVSEAYETLKDTEKRAAYDELGRHASGEDFRPPPDWQRTYGSGEPAFDDIDLADLFASLAGGARGHRRARAGPLPGQDYEARVALSFEQAYHGAEVELDLGVIEPDEEGGFRRATRRIKTRIPKGVVDGQTLRVPGKGAPGIHGGPPGDLFLDIVVAAHPLYRMDGLDLHVDLPLAPWEAVLGASVEIPTPAGRVALKVPAGTRSGQTLRLAGRGMTRADGKAGHLYAHAQIAVPTVVDDKQRALYRQLAESSAFDPRAHLEGK